MASYGLDPMFGTGDRVSGSERVYRPPPSSPDSNINHGLPRMIRYARDRSRKNPELHDALRTRGTNVFGTGITAISLFDNAEVRHAIDAKWQRWSGRTDCDFYGMLHFPALCRLALRQRDDAGGCFIRAIYTPPSDKLEVPFQLQLIEPEMLDISMTQRLPNGGKIIGGVELDARGKRVAYWFFKEHPHNPLGGAPLERTRVPLAEIFHMFEIERPAQTLGNPRAYTATTDIRSLDEYEYAELERKKNTSSGYLFIKSPDNSAVEGFGRAKTFQPGEGEEGEESAGAGGREDYIGEIEPGSVIRGYPGEEMQNTEPAKTDDLYPEYVKGKKRSAARSMGMSYESYTGDLEKVNFSSIRVGLNQEESKYRTEQDLYAATFLTWVWEKWMDIAVMAGALDLPNYFAKRIAYQEVMWQAPGWKYVNPLQEIKALEVEVDMGLISKSQAAAQRGRNFEDVVARRAADKALEKSYGVFVPPKEATETTIPAEPENPDKKDKEEQN